MVKLEVGTESKINPKIIFYKKNWCVLYFEQQLTEMMDIQEFWAHSCHWLYLKKKKNQRY